MPEHLEVEDNGHSVEAEIIDPESSIEVAGTEYGLKQFHVHMPSEERFDGKQFPAIVHLVHVSADDGIAVIAVPVRPGAENPAFDFEVPDGPDQGVRTSGTVNPADLLPESDLAYRYQGSLTTPPCTEGVIWTVFEQPITLSPEQLATLGSAHSGNARPVQPSNGRSVKLGPALAD